MKVSIVTVVRNAEDFIEDCIKSVLSQDYKDIEYIVIDGRSTDHTLEIIQQYRNRIQIFVSETDEGLYHALNKGIAQANGEVIGILNADDFFASQDVISLVSNCFHEKRCEAVYGNLDMFKRNRSGKVLRRWRSKQHQPLDLKLGWMPAHPTFYIKRSVLLQYDAYRPQFGVSADYELILRLLYRHRIHAIFLCQTLVHMRSGGISNGSPAKLLNTFINDYRALKENEIPSPLLAAVIKKIRKIKQYF